MDYSTFKSLQLLLFFGSAMGFCLWQLAQLRRLRRERAQGQQKMEGRATPAAEAAVQQAVALTRGKGNRSEDGAEERRLHQTHDITRGNA
jgi:hypothetical protein